MEFLPRKCIEDKKDADPRPLTEFRTCSAYVLLAEPGAGKTRCFKEEAINQEGVYITAREFLYRDEPKAEWKEKNLFIDGLDEVRAGGGNGPLPLYEIINHLERLHKPQFRLSCREADWLSSLDREALQALAPEHDLTVLRLAPLTEEDIEALLVEQLGSLAAAKSFTTQAEAAGFSELLVNPKNLEILLKATSDGTAWPHTRREAFELACRKLVLEHSELHQASSSSPSVDEMLEAAGLICTLLLLADKSGLALRPANADELYPSLTEIRAPRPLPLEAALKSKLFTADGDGRRAPTHRNVAEYLAARYLTSQIGRSSFSLERLLSLLSGYDGRPVAGLRGLWAWLASFVESDYRRRLIDADPFAVVLYGDVQPLPQIDKKYLIQSLHRAAQSFPWLLRRQESLSPFGALATPDMVGTFQEILAEPACDEAQQVLMYCVLQAIQKGKPLREMADTLGKVFRDANRRPIIRSEALRSLLHVTPATHSNSILLLLGELHAGAIEDNDYALLEILLNRLYPHLISPQQIFDYLRDPKQAGQFFWCYYFIKRTPDNAIPLMLDQLSSKPLSKQLTDDHGIWNIAGQLLIRGIEIHGDHISQNRLYDWLSIGLDEFLDRGIEQEQSIEIANWISADAGRYKAILSEGITRAIAHKNDGRVYDRYWREHLYGATSPADLSIWLLTKAENTDDAEIAEHLFHEAVAMLWRGYGNEGLTLEGLETWVAVRPRFHAWFEKVIYWPIPGNQSERDRKRRDRAEHDAANKREWISFFLKHKESLNEGIAPPGVMANLAFAYFDHLVVARGNTPHERLRKLFDSDQEMVDISVNGLRRCPFRDDLPSAKEITQLSIEGHRHLISLPCLAGMEEAPENLFELDDAALEKLLAMYFTLGLDEEPEWLRVLRHGMPELFSKALIEYAIPALRSNRGVVFDLSGFAFNHEYEFVVPVAVPALLSKFPLRVKAEQFRNLEYLLKAALRYLGDEDLLTIIEEKLVNKSLEAGQRTLWLAAGFITSPGRFHERLQHHAGKNQTYAQQVAQFLSSRSDKWPFRKRLNAVALAWLIGLLGAHSAPYKLDGIGWATAAMNMADLVNSLIAQLGSNPTNEAANALTVLASNTKLKAWQAALRSTIHEQATLQREDQFRHPEISDILRTLENQGPATVADLASLTLEHLEALASRFRDGSNNEYRKFWSYDASNKVLSLPKPENDCRDTLLADLQALLPRQVSARKEGYFAEDKRADIVVYYNDNFQIPIEIKRDNHRNLWRGIRDQLITRYTREPKAGGHGIYAVLWFGGNDMQPPPSGPKPRNPEELASRLRELLTTEEEHRIGVVVIDCSLPNSQRESISSVR